MTKLTDPTIVELTTPPAPDDVSHIVDKSDTTHDPAGTSKRIKYSTYTAPLLRNDGSVSLTNDWDAGSHKIRAETFQSDVPNGTAPLDIASSTKVDNLNVDKLDNKDETDFVALNGRAGGQQITGGINAGENLVFNTTSNPTKGNYKFSELNTLNGIVQTDGSGNLSSFTILPDGTTATTQPFDDNSTKLATMAGVQGAISIGVPTAIEDILATSAGQTAFTASQTPLSDAVFWLVLDGMIREREVDYTRSGTSITWLNPNGELIQNDSDLRFYYNKLSISSQKEHSMAGTDYNANFNNYRVRSIAGTGAHRFTMKIPDDYASTVSFELRGFISSGAAGSGKDIDITSQNCKKDEDYNIHEDSDTATSYDFSGKANKLWFINVAPVATTIEAGDTISFFIDHNGIGGAVYYTELSLTYNT